MDNKFEYYDIARIQLDEAIRLYNQENYICATTLAGASEGILNDLLVKYSNVESSRNPLLESFKKKFPDITHHDLNEGRNFLKHIVETSCEKDQSIKHWAEIYILLAIGDYFKLTQNVTKEMVEFWKQNSDEILNRNFESEVA